MAKTETNAFSTFETVPTSLPELTVIKTVSANRVSSNAPAMGTIDVNKFQQNARRPLRGIQLKKESVATMWINSDSLKNSSVDGAASFTSNFLVNSISENRQEKHQTVLTFGKDYVYFFGEQPRQITVNATLLNSANFRWEEEWWYNYEHTLRGTKLAASNTEIKMYVDENIIKGFLISANTTKDSANPHVVNLSFVLHVTKIVHTRATGLIGSSLINDDDGSYVGNVDLNIEDVSGPLSPLNPMSIGENSSLIRERNQAAYSQQEVGTIGRLYNSSKDFLNSTSKKALDFLYGRNIVIPSDILYSNFASGSAQTISADSIYNKQPVTLTNHLNKFSGKYTDNFDEFPFRSIVFTPSNQSSILDNMPANEESDLKAEVALIKSITETYGVSEDSLYNTESAKGIPLFSGVMGTLSKGAFAVASIVAKPADSYIRDKVEYMDYIPTNAVEVNAKAADGINQASILVGVSTGAFIGGA